MSGPPLISVIGKSKSGKTTLIEKLIRELRRRGYRVATIKHHFHTDQSLDTPGKDTYRHAQAGAERVVLISPLTTVIFDYPPQPPTPQQVAAQLTDFDIVLTEGFSQAELPAIEVLRAERHPTPMANPSRLLAIAANFEVPDFEPVFDWNDAEGLATLLERKFLQG